MRGRGLLWGACLVLAAVAQRPGADEIHVTGGRWQLPPLTLTAQTTSVDVETVVRHADGSVISGLTQANFQIYDNGKLQDSTAFSTASAPPPPAAAPTPATSVTSPAATPSVPATSPRPRFIALLFDDVSTEKGELMNARNAAERFVREALGPADQAAVLTTSESVNIGFSGDRAKVSAAIAQVAPHPRANRSLQNCPRITPYEADMIVEYNDPTAIGAVMAEAVKCDGTAAAMNTGNSMDNNLQQMSLTGFSSTTELVSALAEATWQQARALAQDNLGAVRDAVADLSRQPGSRVLVLASSGFISDTLGNEQDDIIQDAIHHDVVINALDARGLFSDAPGRPIDEVAGYHDELPIPTMIFEETTRLPQKQAEDEAAVNLAQSTGGLFFQNNNDLTLGFERLGLQPELTYELAFQPQALIHDGKLHKLEVKLDPPIKGAIIQTRRAYYAPAPDTGAGSLAANMANAMRSDATSDAVAAALTTSPRPSGVAVHMQVDAAKLDFNHNNGRYRQQLEMIAGLFDAQGKFVAGERGAMDMALRDDTWKRFKTEGLGTGLTVAAPPGDYTLRVVLGEANGGKFAAFSQPVSITH